MADKEIDQMEWSEKYSVNEEKMDKQHQWLFELFNQIIVYLNKDLEPEQNQEDDDRFLLELIGELEDYTRIHFLEEEKLMKSLNFLDYEDHIMEHRKFEQKVRELKKHHTDGMDKEVGTEAFLFLRDWLSSHILIKDLEYKKIIK